MSMIDEIRRIMADKQFSTIEEAQSFLDSYSRASNSRPREEFHGLSPDQMCQLLYRPFDSPALVEFAPILARTPSVLPVTLFALLVDAIGAKGLKPTATGNLPRKLVDEIAVASMSEEGYEEHVRFGQIRSETDFPDLHITNVVAQAAGLIRKYKGRLILGRECRRILANEGIAGIYPRFLRCFVTKFNWGYDDSYQDLEIVQTSAAFTLYLLHLYGDDWRDVSFYGQAFLKAFPRVTNEVMPTDYIDPIERVLDCYVSRSLMRFAHFMGLIETQETQQEANKYRLRTHRVKRTSFFDEVVRFYHPVTRAD